MRSASARAPSGSMHEIIVPELKRGTPRYASSPSPCDWKYARSASSWRLSASSRFVVERLKFTTSNAFSIRVARPSEVRDRGSSCPAFPENL
jgi:hypothetical protein